MLILEFLAKRIAQGILIVVITSLIIFTLLRVVPGDPVRLIVGGMAPADVVEKVATKMGLRDPIVVQYGRYMGGLLHGDLGTSVITANPVLTDLLRFFPATLELSTAAILIGVLVGVPAGVAAGACKGRWPDHLVRLVGLFGYSMPVFWMGLVGLFVFYGRLGWVAGPGRLDAGYEDVLDPVTGVILLDSAMAGAWDVFRNALAHLALPAAVLGYLSLATIARMTRGFTIAQLSQDYVTTALIKGRGPWGAVWRHAFPNILVPLITVVGLSYATLLEGAVLTETVFAWPGLGLYITQSLFNADMNAVLGGTVVVGAAFIGINLTSDALYRLADPRLRAR